MHAFGFVHICFLGINFHVHSLRRVPFPYFCERDLISDLRLQAQAKANTTETYAPAYACSSVCMSRGVGRARLCIKPLT